MASSAFDTFAWFSYLPAELQKQVWEQAAANLPVLDIQRFEAEIARTQPRNGDQDDRQTRLCFSPHADFITLTAGHRGLMGACTDSRKAALPQMPGMLPIYYVTTDATGTVVARRGRVPFNTAGYFCISGLNNAVYNSNFQVGARGVWLPYHPPNIEQIVRIEVGTASQIKKLMIALDPARHPVAKHEHMRGWSTHWIENVIRQMRNLEKVSLIGEGIVNRRHRIESSDFNRVLQIGNIRHGSTNIVHWNRLWKKLKLHQDFYYARTQGAINGLENCLLDHPPAWGRDRWDPEDITEFAAEKTELELTLRAIME